jgi:mRNA-degrading endonuclease RelE of RelBE toxin-antitoxin system
MVEHAAGTYEHRMNATITCRRRPRGEKLTTVTTDYGFQISPEIERRMGRYRASIRQAIRTRLGEIAERAGKARQPETRTARKEPTLRFNADEDYRIAYQVDSQTRRVVVLDIELRSALAPE